MKHPDITGGFRWLLPVGTTTIPALTNVQVFGGGNVPPAGPFVVAMNHNSEFDPIVNGYAIWKAAKRAPHFLAKSSLWNVPGLGAFLDSLDQVPVDRAMGRERSRASLERAREMVAGGTPVIVYPEGTLTKDPELWPMRGKIGAVWLAVAAGVPLIPAAQWGAQRILPRGGKVPMFVPRRTCRVLYGKPMDVSHIAGTEDRAGITQATEDLMEEIKRLLAKLRGESAPEGLWNPGIGARTPGGRVPEASDVLDAMLDAPVEAVPGAAR